MISRITLKDKSLTITDRYLVIGSLDPKKISLQSIDNIQFYEPSDSHAGYITIVRNQAQDADIIFFHKKYREHFHGISEAIKSQARSESMIQKKAS